MREVYEYLKKAGAYFLATVGGDQPRVRPFGTYNIFEDKLYIQTGLIKNVAKQMLANPKVEISAMVENSWIRIEAEAVYEDNIEAQKSMLEAYPSLQANYQPGDGNTAVYYLKNATATIYGFGAEPKVIKF